MKRLKKLNLLVLALCSISALSGCSVFTIGEENFACSGMPGDTKCMSTSDMYEYSIHGASSSGKVLTGNGAVTNIKTDDPDNPVTVYAPYTNVEETDEGVETEGQIIVGDDIIVQNFVTPRLPYSPIPVRTPSMVMRIWIASYTDLNGDLNSPGYVYTEIEPRKWVIAPTKKSGQSKTFSPLVKKPKQPANGGMGATGSGNRPGITYGKDPTVNNLEKLKQERQSKGKQKK